MKIPKLVRFLGTMLVVKPLKIILIALGCVAGICLILGAFFGMCLVLGFVFTTITFFQYMPGSYEVLATMGGILFAYLYVGTMILMGGCEACANIKKSWIKAYNKIYKEKEVDNGHNNA